MTKVDAIEQVMLANGGSASLSQIYDQIDKFYPTAKQSATWDAGIRGVLYRELRQGSRFKKNRIKHLCCKWLSRGKSP